MKIASIILIVLAKLALADNDEVVPEGTGRFAIEGKVYPPELFSSASKNWQSQTQVSISNGEYLGFLKDDGSFVISGVPSGSYVVDIINADYLYESVRQEFIYFRKCFWVVNFYFSDRFAWK